MIAWPKARLDIQVFAAPFRGTAADGLALHQMRKPICRDDAASATRQSSRRCPCWVRLGSGPTCTARPLYPQQRTSL